MLDKYKCKTANDYENALKEIMQEIALLGLWRAKFFEQAAFYGGTSLRILYGLDRFSEDLDFSLLKPQEKFDLAPYLTAIEAELDGLGFNVTVEKKNKIVETAVESAFIKAGTKEHLLKISVPKVIAERAHTNSILTVKVEVDTDPPPAFDTEAKVLLQPIPFSVNTYQLPDLFAGKLHCVLERKWKNRVKGRDFYDFVWYVGRGVPVRIKHLEERLRQSGAWSGKASLTEKDLIDRLKKKFSELDVDAARKDVLPFLRDPAAVEIWSRKFFDSLTGKLVFAKT
jgi:predicted nucleotidyltransferase component of viral defense system